jgi:hypothetical protein
LLHHGSVFTTWRFGHIPVLRKRAYEILGAMIGPYVNVNLLYLEGYETLAAIRVVEKLDCIDRDQTKLIYRPDGSLNIIRPFENLVIRSSAVVDKHIFCIDVYPYRLFVSNEFKLLVEKHNLTGIIFNKVTES